MHVGKKLRSYSGFTIVELLIVIVVIGILATITIVAFNGIQDKARVATVTSDVKSGAKLLKLYQVDKFIYPTSIDCSASPAANSICIKASNNSTISLNVLNTTSPQSYCISSTNGGVTYFANQNSEPTQGTCATTNLAMNPNAETNSTNYGYYAGSGSPAATFTRMTDGGYSGAAYLRVAWTAGPSAVSGGPYYGSTSETVTAGQTYTYSAYVRPSKNITFVPSIEWYSGVTRLLTSYGSTFVAPANTWTRISVNGVAPAGVAWARITAYPYSGAPIYLAGDSVDIDAVMLTQGPTLYNFFDGSSTAYGWGWNGAAGSSTSSGIGY